MSVPRAKASAWRWFLAVLMAVLLTQALVEAIAKAAQEAHVITPDTRATITIFSTALFYTVGISLIWRIIDGRLIRVLLVVAIVCEIGQKALESFVRTARDTLAENVVVILTIGEQAMTRMPVILLTSAFILILMELEKSRRVLQQEKRKLQIEMEERKRIDMERDQLAVRVHKLEKERSLGFLAAGVAHDFNNLLAVVTGYADIISASISADSCNHAHLKIICDAAYRGAELSNELLAYAGDLTLARDPIDLAAATNEVVQKLGSDLPAGIDVIFHDGGDQTFIEGDSLAIGKLVTALFENAIEATTKGTVIVSVGIVKNTEYGVPGFSVGNLCVGGPCAFVRIVDRGKGIDPDTLAHAFDPFFSTKFLGRGLGLPAALGIARSHGGAIYVSTVPDCGSTFEARFPLASGRASSAQRGAVNLPGQSRIPTACALATVHSSYESRQT